MEKIEQLKEVIRGSKRICVFTGAGISCPSGIPDFRSAKGIYHQETGYTYSPEEMISHSFFLEHITASKDHTERFVSFLYCFCSQQTLYFS